MNATEPRTPRKPQLTEYVLVVLVMGAIGLVGFPRPVAGTNERAVAAANDAALEREARAALASLRGALEAYRADHGHYPALDGPYDDVEVVAQLTEMTDAAGIVPAVPWSARSRFGPYLWELPANPFSGRRSVRVLHPDEVFPRRPRGRAGWIYQPRTGEIRLDTLEELPDGHHRFYDL